MQQVYKYLFINLNSVFQWFVCLNDGEGGNKFDIYCYFS